MNQLSHRIAITARTYLARKLVQRALVMVALLGQSLTNHALSAEGEFSCALKLGRIVSIQGLVEVKRIHSADWVPARRLDSVLCDGDMLRVGVHGRAAAILIPETVFRIDHGSLLSVKKVGNEVEVEMFRTDRTPSHILANACGAGYFITRFPRGFRVKTPFLNATVDGTEFQMALACNLASLSVMEGRVRAETVLDASIRQLVNAGEAVASGSGPETPPLRTMIQSRDSVQWTLYFPRLSDGGTAPVIGNCDAVADQPKCRLERAEALLQVGRALDARKELSTLRDAQAVSADVLAFDSIIALANSDSAEALKLARRATAADPSSSRAVIALSYALQGQFRLEEALQAARNATVLKPDSPLALTRVAQLLMAIGDISGAEAAIIRTLEIDAEYSNAHTTQGFVRLARLRPAAARDSFQRAVELDSTDPMPRLGLGLASIREGNVQEGREQIEIAVALDPYNALLRSYLGKAYFEENSESRDELARDQFDMAKGLDPNDPTPHYYDAMLLQSRADSLRAIEEVREALARNDFRAVVRGNLLLSEDLSVRAATLARMYQDIGLERPAQLSAADAITASFGNGDAHAFLADSYAYSPGLTVARENELFQSRMRSPLGLRGLYPLRPVQSSNAFISRAGPDLPLGPSRISPEEATRLFTSNGVNGTFETFAGGMVTDGMQGSAQMRQDRLSFSVGVGSLQAAEAGNSFDVSQDSAEVAIQGQPWTRTTFLAESLLSDVQRSDTRRDFDESLARPMATRQVLKRHRLGARIELTPASNLLVTAARQQRASTIVLLDTGSTTRPSQSGDIYEFQYLHETNSFNVLAGAGRALTGTKSSPTARSLDATHENAYTYGTLTPNALRARLIAGLAWDNLDRSVENFRRKQFSPKFGMVVQPWEGGTLRAASVRAVKRELIAAQSLEPTQIAGFNQVYDDLNGTSYRRIAAGADQWMGRHILIGAESSHRKLHVPVLALAGSEDFLWHEKETRLYAYGILPRTGRGSRANCSGMLGIEHRDRSFSRGEELPGPDGLRLLNSRRWIFTSALQCYDNMTLLLTPQLVSQDGTLQAIEGADLFSADDRFWLVDASVQFRLPRRLGSVSIGVANLTDHKGGIGDRDPYAPSQPQGRQLFARLSIGF